MYRLHMVYVDNDIHYTISYQHLHVFTGGPHSLHTDDVLHGEHCLHNSAVDGVYHLVLFIMCLSCIVNHVLINDFFST